MLIISLSYNLLLFINQNPEFLMLDESKNEKNPIRWSQAAGVPQSWALLGTALVVYRTIPGNPRIKGLGALSTMAIMAPQMAYYHAVENADNFNKFIYSIMMLKNNKNWPTEIPKTIGDKELQPIIAEHKAEIAKQIVDAKVKAKFPTTSNNSQFIDLDLSSLNLSKDISLDDFINFFLQFFTPVPVEGHLDDLLGRQIFIYFLLLIIVLGLIVLFIIYMFINIFLHNKDFILNKFNYKLFRFMVKYQIFLGKISIFTLPLLILFGLIELAVGLHYLITHPIAWENLPLDLHAYISSTKSK